MRKIIFANEQVYHIFNRGVDKRIIFSDKREYNRGTLALDYYRYSNPPMRLSQALLLRQEIRNIYFDNLRTKHLKQIEFIAYCLMPNHFHFLLRQKIDGGITKFMKNFTDSYSRYFNTKHNRKGPLMESVFKALLVETDEAFLHVSRYIHLNPVVSYLVKESDLENYQWSSLREYLGSTNSLICDTDIILNNFKSKDTYRKFIYDQIDYAKKLKEIQNLMFDS